MAIAIKVENVSKQYRLGKVGTGTIAHDLNRWWHLARGKEDPYMKVGELNDRTSKGSTDYVWALRNINFDITQGDVVGIIGRNGAGKSTLLKILSRTTAPTIGSLKIRGRVASLLEVGTGFHPELSGRENIFLNGAILGMTRSEIARKFDEIVDFSGVERYIDTPVKRYSSGMYVRLAFAVAAHLESEILIVDEVLAVGDSEFQNKCLGKMGQISNFDGRTVIFVSHNMASIRSLCSKGLYMNNGQISYSGDIATTIEKYISTGSSMVVSERVWEVEQEAPGNSNIKILGIKVTDSDGNPARTSFGLKINFVIRNFRVDSKIGINIKIYNQNDILVLTTEKWLTNRDSKDTIYHVTMAIPHPLLNQGIYRLAFYFGDSGTKIASFEDDFFTFQVLPYMTENGTNPDRLPGINIPQVEFHIVEQ